MKLAPCYKLVDFTITVLLLISYQPFLSVWLSGWACKLSFKREEIFKINNFSFRFGEGLAKWTCSFCFCLPIVRALWEKQNVQGH